MSVDLYATKIVSEVLADRKSLEVAYRNFPDSNLYFMLVDLIQSTNYRLKNGPERGYIRGESFFSLIRAAIRPYGDIRLFKEIGDAVLLCSSSFRPLFETAYLASLAAKQLAFSSDDMAIPFGVRIGIDFGLAKRLTRHNEDYLGEVIDRLARIMSVRSERANLLVGEHAFKINEKVLAEYGLLCVASDPLPLRLPDSKAVSEPVVYREIAWKAQGQTPFSDYFVEWQKAPTAGGFSAY